MLEQKIASLADSFAQEIASAVSSEQLENMKIKYFGKRGVIAALMQGLREVSQSERPAAGKQINDLKESLQEQLNAKLERLTSEEESLKLAAEALDVTLPARRRRLGRLHPITQMQNRMLSILSGMGFSIQQGPDIDSDYYNFEALNMGPDHPARAMQDTFYITPKILLRTHTTNIDVRVMESHRPPLRIAATGRVFRNEDISARSHVFFHQIEAFYIDRNVCFGDLLATLKLFLQKLFDAPIEVRARPSYFPFVEPGMEADIRCLSCEGSGCHLCKQTGWMEIGGAGMLHPEVLRCGGIDPEEYSGFAWGLGVDRLTMQKYGIPDIRLFVDNDLRFLSQF